MQLAVLAVLWLLAGRFSPARVPLLVYGGIAFAVLNALTLVLSGKPWGETLAFALWGSKLLALLGADKDGWAYWDRSALDI